MKRPSTKDELMNNLVNGEIDLYIDQSMINDYSFEYKLIKCKTIII